jgi:hypothetical protein
MTQSLPPRADGLRPDAVEPAVCRAINLIAVANYSIFAAVWMPGTSEFFEGIEVRRSLHPAGSFRNQRRSTGVILCADRR